MNRMLMKHRIFNKYIVTVFLIFLSACFMEFFVQSGMYQYTPFTYETYHGYSIEGFTKEQKEESRKEAIGLIYDYDLYATAPIIVFSFLLPILSCVPAIAFINEKKGLFFYKYARNSKLKRVISSSIVTYAFITSLALYLAYIIYCLVGIRIFNPDPNYVRDAWDFLFGEVFEHRNVLIYYILVGFIQIFSFSFVYNFFACTVSLVTQKVYMSLVIPMVYFIGGNFLFYSPIIRLAGESLAPGFTITLTGYAGVSALEALLPLIIPIVISVIVYNFAIRSKERI